jgi:putative endonuclease
LFFSPNPKRETYPLSFRARGFSPESRNPFVAVYHSTVREYRFYVYIMASDSGTLYIGVTNRVDLRTIQHKEGRGSIFTSKYGCDRLVYFETFIDVHNALARETQLKTWRREKKVTLIESINPEWKDLGKHYGKPFTPLTVRDKGIPRLGAKTTPRSE